MKTHSVMLLQLHSPQHYKELGNVQCLWEEFTVLMHLTLDIKALLFSCYSRMTKEWFHFQQRFISMSNDLEKLHKI